MTQISQYDEVVLFRKNKLRLKKDIQIMMNNSLASDPFRQQYLIVLHENMKRYRADGVDSAQADYLYERKNQLREFYTMHVYLQDIPFVVEKVTLNSDFTFMRDDEIAITEQPSTALLSESADPSLSSRVPQNLNSSTAGGFGTHAASVKSTLDQLIQPFNDDQSIKTNALPAILSNMRLANQSIYISDGITVHSFMKSGQTTDALNNQMTFEVSSLNNVFMLVTCRFEVTEGMYDTAYNLEAAEDNLSSIEVKYMTLYYVFTTTGFILVYLIIVNFVDKQKNKLLQKKAFLRRYCYYEVQGSEDTLSKRKSNIWSSHPVVTLLDFRGFEKHKEKWYKVILMVGNAHLMALSSGVVVINKKLIDTKNIGTMIWVILLPYTLGTLGNLMIGYLVNMVVKFRKPLNYDQARVMMHSMTKVFFVMSYLILLILMATMIFYIDNNLARRRGLFWTYLMLGLIMLDLFVVWPVICLLAYILAGSGPQAKVQLGALEKFVYLRGFSDFNPELLIEADKANKAKESEEYDSPTPSKEVEMSKLPVGQPSVSEFPGNQSRPRMGSETSSDASKAPGSLPQLPRRNVKRTTQVPTGKKES